MDLCSFQKVSLKDLDTFRKDNSWIRKRADCEYRDFRPSQSKTMIDKIDRFLADHYGFTAEELDFIINYDIKHRMGQDSGEDGDK